MRHSVWIHRSSLIAALAFGAQSAIAADFISDVDVTFFNPLPSSVDKWLILGDTAASTSTYSSSDVQFRAAIIGRAVGANGNVVTLDGWSNPIWQNFYSADSTVTGPAFVVGESGANNSLKLSPGSTLSITHVDGASSADDVHIGYRAGANGNSITVETDATLSAPASTIYVGYNANSN